MFILNLNNITTKPLNQNKMKANELRIGNYVMETIYDFEPKQIVFQSVNFTQPDDYYSPIPLTEEWLVKFGFNKNIHTSYSDGTEHGFKIISYHLLGISYNEYQKVWYFNGKQILDIQYVHQLQNLYFALTEEELTFKSE